MSQKSYFRLAAAFFVADVIFHLIRLFVWFKSGEVMEFPLWISPISLPFTVYFAWKGIELGRK